MMWAFTYLLGIASQELGLLRYIRCGSHGMAIGALDGAAALLRYCSLLPSAFGFKHDLVFVCWKRGHNCLNGPPELRAWERSVQHHFDSLSSSCSL